MAFPHYVSVQLPKLFHDFTLVNCVVSEMSSPLKPPIIPAKNSALAASPKFCLAAVTL